ncbi:MAG: bifunctional DNA-formamidopyrimidine glycosylase/DNA-(apurinic or apyrimidinic site) lyase [Bryobacteraceae bacterium]|nr:bifunctional DNA-formamidopyrimidine glycosylase/DNA-(apurinic or apyrimidinic site) lyase [Bryobacteraceae bacterium]
MPELPEAETIVRTLAPHVEGRRIVGLRFHAVRARMGEIPPVEGRVVRRVSRYGKQVLLELDDGALLIQLRMTGALVWNGAPGPYTRAVLELENGAVCFNDIRQFGSIRWLSAPPRNLGPDPLEIPLEAFVRRLEAHRGRIKPLLLDQRFVRGLGNIYVDEILFRAGIHPRARVSRLSRERAARLHRSMEVVLRLAIDRGGSSISDYVDAEGRRGSFQELHQAYGRAGAPCFACGRAIRRIVVGQRGTHYCPKCQRP